MSHHTGMAAPVRQMTHGGGGSKIGQNGPLDVYTHQIVSYLEFATV